MDVVVLYMTLPLALESEAPVWLRATCGLLATVAVILGIRSVVLLVRHRAGRDVVQH